MPQSTRRASRASPTATPSTRQTPRPQSPPHRMFAHSCSPHPTPFSSSSKIPSIHRGNGLAFWVSYSYFGGSCESSSCPSPPANSSHNSFCCYTPCPRAANRSQNLQRDEVAPRRAVPRRARTGRDGGTEPAEYLLFRRNRWWRLENHRRWYHLGFALR